MKKSLAIIIALVLTLTMIVPFTASSAGSVTISLPEDPSMTITLTGAGEDYAIFTDYGMAYIVSLSASATVTFSNNVDIGSMGATVGSATAGQVLTPAELLNNYVYAPNMASYIMFVDEAGFAVYAPAGKVADLAAAGGTTQPAPQPDPTPAPAAPSGGGVTIALPEDPSMTITLTGAGDDYAIFTDYGMSYIVSLSASATVTFSNNVDIGSMGATVASAAAGQVLTPAELLNNYVYAPNMASYIMFVDEAGFAMYAPAGKVADLAAGGGTVTQPPVTTAPSGGGITIALPEDPSMTITLTGAGDDYAIFTDYGMSYIVALSANATVVFSTNVDIGSMGATVASAAAGQVLTPAELLNNYVYAPNMASYIMFVDEAGFAVYAPAGKVADLAVGGVTPSTPPAGSDNGITGSDTPISESIGTTLDFTGTDLNFIASGMQRQYTLKGADTGADIKYLSISIDGYQKFASYPYEMLPGESIDQLFRRFHNEYFKGAADYTPDAAETTPDNATNFQNPARGYIANAQNAFNMFMVSKFAGVSTVPYILLDGKPAGYDSNGQLDGSSYDHSKIYGSSFTVLQVIIGTSQQYVVPTVSLTYDDTTHTLKARKWELQTSTYTYIVKDFPDAVIVDPYDDTVIGSTDASGQLVIDPSAFKSGVAAVQGLVSTPLFLAELEAAKKEAAANSNADQDLEYVLFFDSSAQIQFKKNATLYYQEGSDLRAKSLSVSAGKTYKISDINGYFYFLDTAKNNRVTFLDNAKRPANGLYADDVAPSDSILNLQSSVKIATVNIPVFKLTNSVTANLNKANLPADYSKFYGAGSDAYQLVFGGDREITDRFLQIDNLYNYYTYVVTGSAHQYTIFVDATANPKIKFSERTYVTFFISAANANGEVTVSETAQTSYTAVTILFPRDVEFDLTGDLRTQMLAAAQVPVIDDWNKETNTMQPAFSPDTISQVPSGLTLLDGTIFFTNTDGSAIQGVTGKGSNHKSTMPDTTGAVHSARIQPLTQAVYESHLPGTQSGITWDYANFYIDRISELPPFAPTQSIWAEPDLDLANHKFTPKSANNAYVDVNLHETGFVLGPTDYSIYGGAKGQQMFWITIISIIICLPLAIVVFRAQRSELRNRGRKFTKTTLKNSGR